MRSQKVDAEMELRMDGLFSERYGFDVFALEELLRQVTLHGMVASFDTPNVMILKLASIFQMLIF